MSHAISAGFSQIDALCKDFIKPFVIGRKNWLFSATSKGARASAILYSVIETAKANGLEPLQYIHRLLDELPRRKADDSIEDLMPWAVAG